MKPKTIVHVVDDAVPAAKDVALMRALSLAHWYDSDLHVVDVGRRTDATSLDARGSALIDRVARVAEHNGMDGVRAVPTVLSGSLVPAIADYVAGVGANLVVVGRRARRASGYWSAGAFAAALGKVVTPPTIAVPNSAGPSADSGALFRRILVPIDFSNVSLRALSEALALAQQSGGRLRLLHVLDGFPYEALQSASHGLALTEGLRPRIAQVQRELLSLVPADPFNWADIEAATVMGRAARAIVADAAAWHADLIVMGLPRRSRFEDFIGGSTAHSVVRRATAPVLLVPGSADPVGFVDERYVRLAGDPYAAAWLPQPAPVSKERVASWH